MCPHYVVTGTLHTERQDNSLRVTRLGNDRAGIGLRCWVPAWVPLRYHSFFLPSNIGPSNLTCLLALFGQSLCLLA
jgi:hypothetical protein